MKNLKEKTKTTKPSFRKRLLREIREYFLKTETRNYYTRERAFYKECLLDKDFMEYFKNSKNEEERYLFFSKTLPFIVEEISLIAVLLTKQYQWASGLISGEMLRAILSYYNPIKHNKKDLEYDITLLDDGKSLEENALKIAKKFNENDNFDGDIGRRVGM